MGFTITRRAFRNSKSYGEPFVRLLVKLPDLLFGVATSDHQAEAYEPEYADFRDHWEKHQGQPLRGRATDFWNRYPEDIGLARDLGCKIFRFSISWSRVEPRRGEFAAEVLDHYRKVVEAVLAAGMAPLVTLHHFTWPVHVQRLGIPVHAYIYWSITSNREWGLPFGPASDFGFFHIDLDLDPQLRRVPTPSAELYKQIIREETPNTPAEDDGKTAK
jgi:beta-glucosidase/6-phospho-beta-glucosidase/beta-galactosidase